MTNIPNRDYPPSELGRPDSERSVNNLPTTSSSTMWIVLAAAIIVILAIGAYSMSRGPTPVSTTDTTQAAPAAVSPPALPPAAPAVPAPSPAASPAP